MLRTDGTSPCRTAAAALCLALLFLGTGGPAGARETDSGEEQQVRKLTRLQGRAYVGRKDPVVGASVVARREDGSGTIFLTTTDDRGLIRIEDLPDGSYRLEIHKSGLGSVVKEAVEVKFPFRPVVEVAMAPEGSSSVPATGAVPASAGSGIKVAGLVTERSGDGIPEVGIRLIHGDGAADPRLLRSRGDGTFSADGIVPGRYNVEVRGVGFLPVRAGVELDRSSEFAVCLIPQPAEYESSPLDLMPPEEPVPPPGFGGE
jgi:hypothetical protein